MLTFFNKRLRNRNGFTLIELIVVIGILGILAAIAVPRLSGFTDDAKIASDEATYGALNSTIANLVSAGKIDSNVTINVAADGVISGQYDNDGDGTDDTNFLQPGAKFQLDANKPTGGGTITWGVSSGAVTPPVINDVGEITFD